MKKLHQIHSIRTRSPSVLERARGNGILLNVSDVVFG